MNEQLEKGLDLMNRLDEISRNKKGQLKQSAINSIRGVEDNVKTFCIITGENPMGEMGSNNQNRTANKNLVNYLKQGNYAWQPVRGKYGNTENSKIIFNILLDEVKHIAKLFQQESFIYGIKDNGVVHFDYYEFNQNDYAFIERKDYYENKKDDTDFYTIIDKNNKFSIPYDYFNESCSSFNNIINETKHKSEKYKDNFDHFLNETLNEKKTLKRRYENRTMIYGGLFK